jgi:hypothetical protein
LSTILGKESASSSWDTRVISTFVVIIASNGGEDTSSSRVARVSGTGVTISTDFSRELTSVSVLSRNTFRNDTLRSGFTEIWAEADLVARTESLASSTTIVTDEIGTRNLSNRVQDSGQSKEVAGLEDQVRGSNLSKLSSRSLSDTNGDRDNSSSFSAVGRSNKISNIVQTIS